jgi:outer membrane protein OmpA-like peptidoglycan-associated protein/tetratricopeptide (TPR) repeat protein
MKKIFLFIILCIFCGLNVFGQSSNKKAQALFEQALSKYSAMEFSEAVSLCDKALKLDAKFADPYLLKAGIAAERKEFRDEINFLNSALKLKPDDEVILSGLGDAYFELHDYREAVSYYKQLLSLERVTVKYRDKAAKNIETAEFRITAMANPVDIKPENLGINVNTVYNDYFPSLSATGSTLVYTIEVPQTASNPQLPKTQEDIYITYRKDGGPWQQARSIGAVINTTNNEGAPFISSDGRVLLFTSCTCPDGLIKCCDIYYSYLKNGEWTYPKPLPSPVNTNYWESQPAFSADNTTLYFVSNRPGGFGGKDIWYSRLTGDGLWSEPVNAGENVNTAGDESSPLLHADNKTLYFASDGHIGMGGQDLFVSRLQPDGTWGKPVNLGYPINTEGNETRLAVSVFGNKAIISSDREKDKLLDLYEIELPASVRPSRTLLVAGSVKDRKTSAPLTSDYEVVDLTSRKTIGRGKTPKDYINLMLFLPEGRDYALNVSSEGYFMNSLNFSLRNIPDSVTKKYIEIALDKPVAGSVITLKNVFFDTDKYEIKPQSFYELDKLADFLTANQGIKVEIGGHTDNQGSEAHNKTLSENRAKAIVKYLTDKKISPERLKAKGYGASQPCADNSTEEGRAKNRRTEVKITE